MVRIGAHVGQDDPAAHAAAIGAEVVQFFLGNPQGYKKPELPAQPVEGVDIFIHAPYLVNVASTNNRIRIPSRKLLAQHLEAAASIGAKGLIVHGGHVGEGDDLTAGFENWRKTFAYAQEQGGFPVPVLIENTAGGDNAMARTLERLARLWDALDGFDVGFCLDTCHAHAGGEELSGLVDRVKAITGRIDLVHCNNSRDAFGTGADRHANLDKGTIDPELILQVCRAAGAPIVVETPAEGQADDIAFLRENL